MKGSEFVFDYVYLLYYKCHKINLNLGGSYVDSPDWIKNKKSTVKVVVMSATWHTFLWLSRNLYRVEGIFKKSLPCNFF